MDTFESMQAQIDVMRQAWAEVEGLRADLASCERECAEIAYDRDQLLAEVERLRAEIAGMERWSLHTVPRRPVQSMA